VGGDGRNQPSGGTPGGVARGAAASSRAEKVIESGLALYSQGDLVGALARWRQALEIDPDNRRARQYVTYVEEHYEVEPTELRPGPRILPCRHRQHEPVVAQALADDPRISVVAVGDHERAHDRYGTPGW